MDGEVECLTDRCVDTLHSNSELYCVKNMRDSIASLRSYSIKVMSMTGITLACCYHYSSSHSYFYTVIQKPNPRRLWAAVKTIAHTNAKA